MGRAFHDTQQNIWHIEAVTLKLRSRSFSHKSQTSAIWWDINTKFDDLESLSQMTHGGNKTIWNWPQCQGQTLIKNGKI